MRLDSADYTLDALPLSRINFFHLRYLQELLPWLPKRQTPRQVS
jgi:hypothetical protein